MAAVEVTLATALWAATVATAATAAMEGAMSTVEMADMVGTVAMADTVVMAADWETTQNSADPAYFSKSVPTTCPRCKHEIMTLVRRRPNALNIAASASALVAGLVFKLPPTLLPLAMLPLQVKALQPKIHYCPRCNYKLGKNVKITVPLEY
ncbi:hypothetical protein H4R23_003150 [Coemansia sp. Cherry 401B]|nr:hypothetical protein H4R23_003150 [Coemansia sp. Cherry 401B]